jgi:uracil-DNA glycosylase
MLSNLSNEWLNLLKTDELDNIIAQLSNIETVPGQEDIFNFARITPFNKLKCVIIGQDPYPTPGDAHGLAFSCLTGTPASLKNIYKCLLKSKLIKEIPDSGNLTQWAEQGVLLLNTALTTIPGKSLAHMKLWSHYTNELIKRISEIKPLVFILWGDRAQKVKSHIDHRSVVLTWAHPSPLATKSNFINCTNFKEANEILVKLGEKPIDWNIYNLDEPDSLKEVFGNTPKTQVVFTDGSCYPNRSCPEAVGAYAASFAYGSLKDVILYGNIDTNVEYATNQRAEGFAILNVLNYLKYKLDEWDKLYIITDSQFWIDMFEKYMPEWSVNNKFGIKKNKDLTVKLWAVYKLLLDKKKEIIFNHVNSHNKSGWKSAPVESYEHFCYINNDFVDNLAEFARTKVEPGKNVISMARYED